MIEILLEAERALTHGLVDQAERLYGQVAAADPRNSIAAVGLARVALERGDEPGAYRHARTALRIDPENPAAQHLVMRMAEVLAARGEKVPAAEDGTGIQAPDAASSPTAGVKPEANPAEEPAARPRRGLIGRLLGRRRKT
jgi:uncharacterized protein HemY